MSHEYIDSLWATKKRQFPFLIGPITVIWESSYGMTIRNPGKATSDELRSLVDAAIERAFEEDIRNTTNNKYVRELITKAGLWVEEPDMDPVTVTVGPGEDNEPVVTSLEVAGEKEVSHMSLEDLMKNGFLTKGVKGGGEG